MTEFLFFGWTIPIKVLCFVSFLYSTSSLYGSSSMTQWEYGAHTWGGKKHLKFNLHFGGKTYNAIQWWCTNKPSSKACCILFDTFYLEIMYGQSVDILRIILEKGLLPAKKKY